jgi:N-acetylglucosamine kinase-like BadF-type ATPase
VGQLAVAVAAAASAGDAFALSLLDEAADELARLARLLIARHGTLPVVLAGRVFDLHPVLMQRLETALPTGAAASRSTLEVAPAAARQCIGLRGSGGASDEGSGASAATR